MKIQTLQSLRFLFMMLIVLFHIVGKDFEFGGDCGVSFFFMLSGLVLSYSYGQKVIEGQFHTGTFLKRQLVKFYPLHLLTFLIMILLEARLERYYDWYQLLPSIFLVQSWFPFDKIIHVGNASSWFLCDLLFFYVIFSFLFKIFSRTEVKRLMIWMALLLAVYILFVFSVPLHNVNNVVCLMPIMRIMDFAIGILVFRFCSSAYGDHLFRYLQSLSSSQLTIVELLAFGLVFLSYFLYGCLPACLRCASLFWLVLPPLLILYVKAEELKGMVTSLLHMSPLIWLGGICMEIYLTHWPVMRIFYSMIHSVGVDGYLPQSGIIMMALLVFIATANLTHFFIVEPVRHRLSAYIK